MFELRPYRKNNSVSYYNPFRDMEEMTKGAGAVMSDHGFLNEKGPFPPLVTIGYETEADECRSVDVAPTILSLFDLELKCDGRVIPGHIR